MKKKEKVLPNNQYGFREDHSTLHAVNKLLTDVNDNLFNNNMVGAVLLDLEKAFDSVWINGLIFILLKKKFPIPLIRVIWNMINGKKFRVINQKNELSSTFITTEGLQQGTINSPCLFSIFTAHMIDSFDLNSGNNAHSIAYADDRIVYVADKDGYEISKKLNNLTNKVNEMYAVWNLKVNPEKSEVILFRNPVENLSKKKKQSIKDFEIKIEDITTNTESIIPVKEPVEYLGIQIDNLTRCSKHLDNQIEKARRRYKSLGYLFHNKHITKKARVICYLLLIRPLLTYGIEILWNLGAHQAECLRVFERNCLRTCLFLYRSQHSNFQH